MRPPLGLPPLGDRWRMASATEVLGIATLLCSGRTEGVGPPTFSRVSFGLSTVGGGGATELMSGSSIFGGALAAASILGGSGSAAGGGWGGVGMGAGRCAMGCVVDGAARGILMVGRGRKAGQSVSL